MCFVTGYGDVEPCLGFNLLYSVGDDLCFVVRMNSEVQACVETVNRYLDIMQAEELVHNQYNNIMRYVFVTIS